MKPTERDYIVPVIYKATNTINGKSYIGFAIDLNNRKKEHHKKAKGDYRKEYFHHAIAKHGAEAFHWEVIKEDATLEDEIRLIEEHQTFWEMGKGYNLTKGGEGKLGYVVSEETKEKLRIAHTGKIPTENQVRVLRENAIAMRGKKRPKEICEQISRSHKGKVFSEEHKANISKNHCSKTEAGILMRQSQEYRDKLSASCKGKKRTPEQKERYRQAALNRTPEHREKCRLGRIKTQQEKKRVLQGF